ncbi:S9 family peptidase [Candidatus Amoebophilus asiaticus]|nr:S9 family peptidase [Candidatus Amoebophilus asiaticus]
MKYWCLGIISFLLICCAEKGQDTSYHYPVTAKGDQVDDYFGTKVADPFRWLEDDNSEETKEWVEAQNKVTFEYLSTIPYRDKIKQRLSSIWNYTKYKPPFKGGEHYFVFKNDGLQNQHVLYILDSLGADLQVFLDANKFSEDGTISLHKQEVSPDGKYMAYSISKGGSDWNEIFVMEVGSRKKLADHLKWSKFSEISWQGEGFYYAKYDAPESGAELTSANEYMKICYHKTGTQQSEDKLVYEDKEHPKRYFGNQVTSDERFLIIKASEGAGGNNALLFKDNQNEDAEIVPLVDNFENSYSVIDNMDEWLIVKTNNDAPKYRVVLINTLDPAKENWKELIPESEDVIKEVFVANTNLVLKYVRNASSRLAVFDFEGNYLNDIDLPAIGNVKGFEGSKDVSVAFYRFSSYTYPPTIFKYDFVTKNSVPYYESAIDFDPEDYVTKQIFYSSKDGEKIPMFLVHKKGIQLDGNNPALLYGYGGFNIPIMPEFRISNLILLENGGIYAVANLRGGSEFGEEWHKAGMLLNKQNVFDDFIAAAEYLIDNKYTSSAKLAIMGRSNGGLLVGATMTQRPDLCKVALPGVGVMDMLRFHRFTIGWAWVTEYGSSEDPTHFKNLYAFSPLHNIRENVNYPATLVTTADHDDRVVPAHSFKFIAELQDKYQGENPVMIRIDTQAGHGAGKPTSKKIDEQTDIWSFVFHNLGVTPVY